jgi:1-deoxy-D-xylulose-5-phosphate reductoisomerase
MAPDACSRLHYPWPTMQIVNRSEAAPDRSGSRAANSSRYAKSSVTILGSTGSIGTQALSVIADHPRRFRVAALAAGGGRCDQLAEQAVRFDVSLVAVSDPAAEARLRGALAAVGSRAKVLVGPDAAAEVAGAGADVVLNAMTGAVGLTPTLATLRAGSRLALANKESLIIGGPLVRSLAAAGQIVPVDSEHSALAQCLAAGRSTEVRRLVLTASGGPFWGRSRAELGHVTPDQALAHPTWDMGPVVTINSATMVNKGLEVIEAHLLFDVPMDRIAVMVHRQSVIHSMVEFVDGSTLAQASPPDMRLPIALALTWPERLPAVAPACDWTQAHTWTFEPMDDLAFPAVELARRAGRLGGTAPAVFNAANEEAVAAFRSGHLPFPGIVDTIATVLAEDASTEEAEVGAMTLQDVLAADSRARISARRVIMNQGLGHVTL